MRILPRIIFLCLLPAHLLGQCLHYNHPAHYFEEALPIGNGRLGAMVYSGIHIDSLSLNDITLWTGEPEHSTTDSALNAQTIRDIREALNREDYPTAEQLQRKLQGHFSENYQPLGRLYIEYENESKPVGKYERWLDISKAVAGNRYSIGNIKRCTEYFCSHPDEAIVIRIRSNKPIRFKLKLDSELPHHTSTEGDEIISDGYAAYHSLPHYYQADTMFYYDPNRGIHYRTIVKVIGAQQISSNHEELLVTANREVRILVCNATSFNGFDKDPVKEGTPYQAVVRAHLNQAIARTYQQLKNNHIDDYQYFFNRVELNLGSTPNKIRRLSTEEQLKRYTLQNECNPDLEELYFQYGRYLLISCSRTEGVPATLQGLWNEKMLPPWSSNYTCNINLEENYWPAEVANLPEMHLPLLSFLKNLSRNGTHTAQQMYGASKGWCLAHNTDIWAMTNPVGLQTGDPMWANWNMGGAWLSTHIWEHFCFTRDTAFLHDYYPTLRGAAEFCMEMLVEKEGYWVTSPSTSPENQYVTNTGFRGATLYGSTADLAIIKECLNDTKKAAAVLDTDHSLSEQIDTILTQLLPYRIGGQGHLQEWYHDWQDADPKHRHQSHLIGLYPGSSISGDTLLAACARSLQLRGDESTGWSTGWRINLYARLLNSEQAYHMLRKLLRYVSPDEYTGPDAMRGGGTYPNLMDAHSPFQIDGNFGGCAGICEMILQSNDDGDVKALPALPAVMSKKGFVRGLKTRSGKVINISWDSK